MKRNAQIYIIFIFSQRWFRMIMFMKQSCACCPVAGVRSSGRLSSPGLPACLPGWLAAVHTHWWTWASDALYTLVFTHFGSVDYFACVTFSFYVWKINISHVRSTEFVTVMSFTGHSYQKLWQHVESVLSSGICSSGSNKISCHLEKKLWMNIVVLLWCKVLKHSSNTAIHHGSG